MECHCNMSISKARVGTEKKKGRKCYAWSNILFCAVSFKTVFIFKETNYLVKGSQFEVWYPFKKPSDMRAKKWGVITSFKNNLFFLAKGICFFQVCERQIKYYLVHLTHFTEGHLMKQCRTIINVVLKFSTSCIPVISIWIRYVKLLFSGRSNNIKKL